MELVSALRKKSEPIYFKTTDVQIDRATGTIKGIVIGQKGFDKSGEYWDSVFLNQLVTAGNSLPKGLKSRFGHPTMCDTTLGSYIGRYKNFSISKGASGKEVVTADLYLDPICKDAPGGRGNLFDYVLNMAEKNNDMFGNSIAFYENERELINETFGAETKSIYALRLKTFDSSDLVDSPCATDELFKDTDDIGVIVTNFLESNPRIFELLSTAKGKDIVDNFLIKLKNHKSNTMKKNEKSLLQQFKEVFGGKGKAFEWSASDGTAFTISDENGDGAAAVGDLVTAPDGSPQMNATLTGTDGSTITTDAEGKISEVKSATPPAPPANDAAAKEVIQLRKDVAELKEAHETTLKEFKEALDLAKKQKEDSDAETLKLKEQLSKLTSKHEVKEGANKVGESGKQENQKSTTNRVEAAYEKKDK